ncbi:uncharacterized protein [Ptychodera flava]|uniref:uncharacterized protein n=1 Tax=Ptychodera flava TaxID=63121 RepID=UPI00396A4E84
MVCFLKMGGRLVPGGLWLVLLLCVEIAAQTTPKTVVKQSRTKLAGLADSTGLSEGFWISVIATAILCLIAILVSCCICCWPVSQETTISKIFRKNVSKSTTNRTSTSQQQSRKSTKRHRKGQEIIPIPIPSTADTVNTYNWFYNPITTPDTVEREEPQIEQPAQQESNDVQVTSFINVHGGKYDYENPSYNFITLPPPLESGPEPEPEPEPEIAAEHPTVIDDPDELNDETIDFTLFRTGVPDTPSAQDTATKVVVEEEVNTVSARTIGINTDPMKAEERIIIVTKEVERQRPPSPTVSPPSPPPTPPPHQQIQFVSVTDVRDESEWVYCRNIGTMTERDPYQDAVMIAHTRRGNFNRNKISENELWRREWIYQVPSTQIVTESVTADDVRVPYIREEYRVVDDVIHDGFETQMVPETGRDERLMVSTSKPPVDSDIADIEYLTKYVKRDAVENQESTIGINTESDFYNGGKLVAKTTTVTNKTPIYDEEVNYVKSQHTTQQSRGTGTRAREEPHYSRSVSVMTTDNADTDDDAFFLKRKQTTSTYTGQVGETERNIVTRSTNTDTNVGAWTVFKKASLARAGNEKHVFAKRQKMTSAGTSTNNGTPMKTYTTVYTDTSDRESKNIATKTSTASTNTEGEARVTVYKTITASKPIERVISHTTTTTTEPDRLEVYQAPTFSTKTRTDSEVMKRERDSKPMERVITTTTTTTKPDILEVHRAPTLSTNNHTDTQLTKRGGEEFSPLPTSTVTYTSGDKVIIPRPYKEQEERVIIPRPYKDGTRQTRDGENTVSTRTEQHKDDDGYVVTKTTTTRKTTRVTQDGVQDTNNATALPTSMSESSIDSLPVRIPRPSQHKRSVYYVRQNHSEDDTDSDYRP